MTTQIEIEKGQKSLYITTLEKLLFFVRRNKSLTVGGFIIASMIFMALFADFISPHHYAERLKPYAENRYAPPSLDHPFGTNKMSYDMLSRVIYGSQIALLMAFTSSIVAFIIGVPLGIISGYYGGKIDRLSTMVADAIYSFPSLLIAMMFALFLTIYFPEGTLKVIAPVAFSTAIVYIPAYFRVIRAQVMQVKEEEYVDAAKSMGASQFTIILRYITPNVLAASIAIIPFNMTDAILTNAALAFLGLGVQAPTADWGFDVYDAQSLSKIQLYPWLIIFPGLMIFLLAFGFSLIGDALNDKFNPLLKENH